MPRSESRIRIRKAISSDVHAIRAIELESSASPWSEASLLSDIENSDRARVLVAVCDSEEVVAYADAWTVAGEAQLNNIAVTSEYRRMHIAEDLMQALIKECSDCTVMQLEVREGNVAARALYNKLGFKEVGIRPNYYEDNGEDAVLMDMEIKC